MLTIAIPVFERTTFFDEALASALNQTRPVKVIIVDNASSHDYFERAAAIHDNGLVKYYRNEVNLGMYGNWNKCIEKCETDYLTIMGDDDYINPTFAEVFYTKLKEHPNLVCFHTDIDRFGDKANIGSLGSQMPLGFHTGIEMLVHASKYGLGISTVSMAFSKNVYPQYQFSYPKWAYSQDWLFAYSAFADGVCYGEKEKLMKYRVHTTGNAVLIGVRAALSQTVIYCHIAKKLKAASRAEYRLAANREKSILRNALIAQEKSVITEMINEIDNPFGAHLKSMLKKDRLANLIYNMEPGVTHTMLIAYIRFLRKVKFQFFKY